MNMTCNNCKYCEKCLESDRNYICTSFRKAEITGKMLKVSKIKTKMYCCDEITGSKVIS